MINPQKNPHHSTAGIRRTSDLADENFGFAAPAEGTKISRRASWGFPVGVFETASGSYRTIVSGRIWESDSMTRRSLVRAAAECIGEYAGHRRRCLVCGIGNPDIPADALGTLICSRVAAAHNSPAPIFTVCPMTQSRTGIDTAVFIRAIADAVHPDLIIACDALCAKSRERLQTVIQISDCGITPGSALSRTNGEISSATMPCPVITIGVPTVISTASMDPCTDEPLLVTRTESDIITDCYATVIAGAINLALFGK